MASSIFGVQTWLLLVFVGSSWLVVCLFYFVLSFIVLFRTTQQPQVVVVAPSDNLKRSLIDRMARFVVANGHQFEVLVQSAICPQHCTHAHTHACTRTCNEWVAATCHGTGEGQPAVCTAVSFRVEHCGPQLLHVESVLSSSG